MHPYLRSILFFVILMALGACTDSAPVASPPAAASTAPAEQASKTDAPLQVPEIIGAWYRLNWRSGELPRIDITSKEVSFYRFEYNQYSAVDPSKWTLSGPAKTILLVQQLSPKSWELHYQELADNMLSGERFMADSTMTVTIEKRGSRAGGFMDVLLVERTFNGKPAYKGKGVFMKESDWRANADYLNEIPKP